MPSIKRNGISIFCILFIVAGVFLPVVSNASVLVSQPYTNQYIQDNLLVDNNYPTLSSIITASSSGTLAQVSFFVQSNTEKVIWSLIDVTSGGGLYIGNNCTDQLALMDTVQMKQYSATSSSWYNYGTSLNITAGHQYMFSVYGTKAHSNGISCLQYMSSDDKWISSFGSSVSTSSVAFVVTSSVASSSFPSFIAPSFPTAVTYPSNPVVFSGVYTNADTYNQIVFDIQNTDGNVQLLRTYNIPLVNGVGLSYSTSYVLPYVGNYSYRAKLYDTNTGSSTSWTSSVAFALGTTTVATSSYPDSPIDLNCATIDIACHIKSAGLWLFSPSGDSTSQFSNLTLRNSVPFCYIYDVGNLRTELFSAQQTATSTVSVQIRGFTQSTSTITFLSRSMLEAVPYAGTIKTILGWLLYLMMIEYVYYRVIRVHDSNTPK